MDLGKRSAHLILDSGLCFSGIWEGGDPQVGEVVFNTSHHGYEEMATDPSYCSQILVTTAPMQGNYGISNFYQESESLWIRGFICLEIQKSKRDASWLKTLTDQGIPVMTGSDTRNLVLHLRQKGTMVGALVPEEDVEKAKKKGLELILGFKKEDKNLASQVSVKKVQKKEGKNPKGPSVAVMDYGCKKNILRILDKICRCVWVFPYDASFEEVSEKNPDGIVLSNGPGDPKDAPQSVIEVIKSFCGWKPVYGICMGHQLLSLALGGKTYKLKFGHRGGNHPIKDKLSNKIYMTSQNHGYAVNEETLPKNVKVTHINLNDNTVAGISCDEKKCSSVQFHPESRPGPHDAKGLLEDFVRNL